ncbi:hypothetical protein ACGFZ9_14095 [Streptomyces mirabilis]|uniref:hypothetical protein n=1 Tax=Streptomyces mirabilis TaxID=68239 RepID=UPI00371F772B
MNQNFLDDIGGRIGSAAAQFAPASKPTPRQMADAASVLRDMVQAVAIHGVTFEHFESVADFPRMAIQLVQRRDDADE